ncbi:MAG: molybdenum ABC transporter ATP-binding protein [Paracoccaceae bacterium]
MLDIALRHKQGDFALDLAFAAPAGVTALFGHSGAGKTTVVRAVAGLLRPDAGHVVVGDHTLSDSAADVWLPPHRRQVGYVFQDARLFPHLSVRQNLAYGQRFHRRRAQMPALGPVAELLGLSALLDRRPAALSGGETQRVALGRALLANPRLLLMDEPLAALDARRKEDILPYLDRICHDSGIPILYVSHSVAEIARLATTVVIMDAGRLRRVGPVGAVLSDPDLAPTMGLRDAGSVLMAEVLAHEADGLSALRTSGGDLWLPRVDLPVGARLRVRIAARDVILATELPRQLSALNILAGRVEALRDGDGPGVMVQVRMGADRILARVTRRSATVLGLRPGADVHAVIKSVSVARVDVGGVREV